MFCDLMGSTPLSEQLDPEDLREVIRAYQQTCTEVIQRFDGHIAQLLGDGLLIYFGWPQAHDDDAQRAVQAGLGILETMQTLNTQLERDKGLHLAVRVGIHTGLVVVGEMGGGGRQEQLALGDTPNVAARLQGLAAPDTVLISAATHRLVQGYFTMAALGAQVLKGVAVPVPVYRILGASAAQSRLDVAATTGLTPLVGRTSEVALLLERWEQSQAGLGQVVLLSGEGGIGKSRLVEVLRQRVVSEDSPCIMLRCSPYHTHSALYPVIEHLQQMLQFQREDSREVKLRKLEEALILEPSPPSGAREERLEVVPLLAALLSVPIPEGRYPPCC
jgi:class 3 adenylate cyclase